MRIDPLCEYITAQLHTYIARISRNLDILQIYTTEFTDAAEFYKEKELLRYLEKSTSAGAPKFSFINTKYCFIHFPDPAADSICIIGPLTLLAFEETSHALHTQEIPFTHIHEDMVIPSLYIQTVTKYALLLCNTLQEDSYTVIDLMKENFRSENIAQNASLTAMDTIFQNRENDSFHTTFFQETRLLGAIESGDIDGLRRNWKEPGTDNIVTYEMRNPIRTGKNYAIYNITACGRAAIRGGLQAEYIFSLTESYMQQIEDLKDMLLLQSIVEEFQYNLVCMVAEKKRRMSTDAQADDSLLNQCKSYVFQHLHDPLTVAAIAGELEVHPNYLSSYFKKKEGLSLYQYILDQKISLVKNMLMYSDYSYIEIANYLGFTSQSHLGTVFKKKTGTTLKAYRDKYKPEGF